MKYKKGVLLMRIQYLKLVNFIGVKAATGLNEIEFQYDRIKQPIIQLYGRNRCGKTVMIQQHHPFSSINLTGDERNDLSLIIPNEIGLKNFVYEVNGHVYNITHTYRPTGKSHTVSTSIVMDGEELNPSGGVTTGNTLIEKHLGINKYIFQFIINGTNLTSFSGMGATQRKTLLNKAMGIDIYDKIHKLATDDYRFTNKLITSLNHTKEYLLQTYGSFETLFAKLDEKRSQKEKMEYELQTLKSRKDALSGIIHTLRQQNVDAELSRVMNSIGEYKSAIDSIGGSLDPSLHDTLVEAQIQKNKEISDKNAELQIIFKEIDDTYDKMHNIETAMIEFKQIKADKERMEQTIDSLKKQINEITIETDVQMSSQYLFSMLSLAQAINSTCKEITSSLNQNHMDIFIQMIDHDIDISAFLMQEGASLMDSEKEKTMISHIRSMMLNVSGDIPDNENPCIIQNCLYRNVYEAFNTYFKSYQSKSKGKFTQYDLEQFDHAYKNILTIKRLINIDIDSQLRNLFDIKNMMHRCRQGESGIDVDYIKYLIEEAAKSETRTKYIQQLHEAEQTYSMMKDQIFTDIDENAIDTLKQKVESLTDKREQITRDIKSIEYELNDIDRKRLMISNIQRIDITQLERSRLQLESSVQKLKNAEEEYQSVYAQYQGLYNQSSIITNDLDILEKAVDQYTKTTTEIEQHLSNDSTFKAIAEATSSTKGMPVIAIRDTVDRAISTANKLLNVMYDGEIELLQPIIDESQFSLPFRCNNNRSQDIRYGSQSESTLLSLALSLSLSSSMTSYSVPLVDEIDAYLDMSIRDSFILMLESMMSVLGMEQMFLISHNLQKDQFNHIVYTVDISEIIQQKGSE
jgi:DNA repair exonuclease SbcCD ATPase subunit